MKMTLTAVCDFQGGTQPPKNEWIDHEANGYVRMLQIRDFTQSEKDNIEYVKDTKNLKKCNENDILIGRYGASVGKILTGLSGAYNVAIVKAIPDTEKIFARYLYYFFTSPYFQNFIKSVGSRAAQAGFNKDDLKNAVIPLISTDEQRKIAAVLDKVSDLIAKRRQQLDKLDELIKARFVEMFGDPVSNSLNFPLLSLPQLGEFGRGVSKHRPRNAPELLGGKYPLIQTGEVANSELYISSYENTYSEFGFKQSKMWKSGTLCITIAANIAKTAILAFDACFPDSVVGFVANEKTNNIFIHYWFGFFQQILEAQAPESAQKNINLKILSELEVIVPPIELQNHFAAFVEQTEKIKTTINKSLEKLETLKKALMQEYFG